MCTTHFEPHAPHYPFLPPPHTHTHTTFFLATPPHTFPQFIALAQRTGVLFSIPSPEGSAGSPFNLPLTWSLFSSPWDKAGLWDAGWRRKGFERVSLAQSVQRLPQLLHRPQALPFHVCALQPGFPTYFALTCRVNSRIPSHPCTTSLPAKGEQSPHPIPCSFRAAADTLNFTKLLATLMKDVL